MTETNMSWTLNKTEYTGDIVTRIQPNQTKQMVCNTYKCALTDLEYNEWRAGAWLCIKKNNKHIHIVRPLETLKTIAKKHNVSVEYLASINQLKNNCVFIGQQLLLD